MKNFVLLTIDNSVQFNRPALTEVLQRLGKHVEYIPGVWLISTDQGIKDVDQAVATRVGGTIKFVVGELEVDPQAGHMPEQVRAFIEDRQAA